MSPPLFETRWGAGPDVVFLHGLGASSRYWHTLAERGGQYRGTAFDLLGFGRSPSPPEATYDVGCHLDALWAQLPPLATVVGHSTGAILAAALAARAPDRVRNLLLLGLPAYPDDQTARESIGKLGLLGRLTVEGRPSARVLCDAMCLFRPLAIAIAPWVIRDLPAAIASDAARHTWPSYSRTLQRVVVEHHATNDLLASNVAVTLVHGRQDRAAPLPFVEGLVRRMRVRGTPVALQVVDGDHHLAVRRPDLIATILGHSLAR